MDNGGHRADRPGRSQREFADRFGFERRPLQNGAQGRTAPDRVDCSLIAAPDCARTDASRSRRPGRLNLPTR